MSQIPPSPPGPEQTSRPPKGNKALLFVILGLFVLVGITAAVLVMGDGSDDDDADGGDGGDGRSPVATAEQFFVAGRENDCEAGVELTTEDSWPLLFGDTDVTSGEEPEPMSRDEAIESCEENSEADDEDAELDSVELVSEDGDAAVVEITATTEGQSDSDEFPLRREGGEWKLDFRKYFEESEGS